ncbi:AAA family ATPase [Nioella sp.]|uniref:AAA family ATPase n=1 Tax=Nioella sp. TaxID=1912091 RepID=UPI003A8730E6
MKLRSITLENVRRFTDPIRIDGIADGVNVLSAPNEFGKSTVFDALRALFFVPHSSTKKDIKHLKPHAGGFPEVTVEVETAEGRFLISKRWFGKPEAKVVRDGLLIAQADEAEAWISRLLGGGDGGPSGLLWVRQGLLGLSDGEKSEQTAALEARRDLLSSVTGEVEAMTGGWRMDAALVRCREELMVFATATGRPKAGGPWAAALSKVETLTTDRDSLVKQVAALQSSLDERSHHRRELVDLEAPEASAERKERLDAARVAFQDAESHAGKVKTAEQALQTATLLADRARQELRTLRDAMQAKTTDEAADQEARGRLKEAVETLSRADQSLAEATKAHEAANEERKRAEAVLRRVQAQTSAKAARDRRAELADRISKAQLFRDKVEAAKATASVGPDDRDMDKLRGLLQTLSAARAVRDSSATRVVMRYDPGCEGGVQHAGTALDDDKALTIHADTVLQLDGLGELTVHPGEGPEGMVDVAEAEADVAKALEALGAVTIEEATRAHQKRQEAKTLLTQLEAEFRAHAPQGIEALQTQLAALPDVVAEEVEHLPSLEEAEAALNTASDRVRNSAPGWRPRATVATTHEQSTRRLWSGRRRPPGG